MLDVTTAPTLLQTFMRRLRQSQCIIQLGTGQQSGVRGDGSAAKLQPYTAVETERGAGVGAFTLNVAWEAVRQPPPLSWLIRRGVGRSRTPRACMSGWP